MQTIKMLLDAMFLSGLMILLVVATGAHFFVIAATARPVELVLSERIWQLTGGKKSGQKYKDFSKN